MIPCCGEGARPERCANSASSAPSTCTVPEGFFASDSSPPARLIALAGGLEPLAKKPSGTVQVLGAEDALFAHLSGRAPSPKHGISYTHVFVRGTRPEDRGSAARALAGKLTLAARVDHYSGERRETLHAELRERMATIRARAETGDGEIDGESADPDAEGDA